MGRHDTPLFTRATGHLLRGLFKGRGQTLEYGEELDTPHYRLSLHPSAHCLGAAQVLVQVKETGERILYTGDLKLRPNATAPATEVVRCDTLVVDATYGAPQYRFPPDAETLTRLRTLVDVWRGQGFTPVVMGYRTGKAQEALWHLTSWGLSVAVDPAVYDVVRDYEEMGVAFPGPFRRLGADGLRDGEVVICPPGRGGLRHLPHGRRYKTVFLTGWAMGAGQWWVRSNSSLPLSDHCDFDDLLSYVRLTGARRVLPVFGGRELARYLKRGGMEARPLDPPTERRELAYQLALI